MIFKKPYAFLIKYFKLINFILAALAGYIAYRSYNIISFFNEYITHNYSGNFYKGFSNTYISSMLYLFIIGLIIGILVIYLLFIYKKKPTKAYLASIIYYVVFIIFLNLIKNVMITLETTVITAEMARAYRDLSLISIIPQIYFILLFLLRGFGFNIGKFNFKEDIKELEISEKDSEEVEITFKKNDVKLKRNLRRFGREFVYYIKENKFIFIIICLALVVGIFFLTYKSLPEIVDQEYKQGETFNIGSLVYRIEDSIITNIDYKGDSLGENTYYVVAKLSAENSSAEELEFDYNDFRLELEDKYVYPMTDKGMNFIDYAVNYYGNKLKGNSKQLYSLVFKISESDLNKNYKLKISNGSHQLDDYKIGKFTYVTITPVVINKVILENTINQSEELSFTNSNLGNTKLTLSNAIITDKYIYNYEECINNVCNTYKDIININYTQNNKLLIVLDYQYKVDKAVPFYEYSSTINKFLESFVKIKYKISDEIKYATIKNVTPTKLNDKLIIETTSEISKAEELFIAIVIRNKEYQIRIK